jgi:hypothetical protein
MVELGFAEIAGVEEDGDFVLKLATVQVFKFDLYQLASSIEHGQIDMQGVIAQLDRWREHGV